ncbi:MAG: PIG-L family deacetylase [Armatimonadetes bacterium]|nr:PIG-L family deacetylase [Armatimonadota bacterium]
MELHNRTAEAYLNPAGPGPGLSAATHMSISAHQDDLEIMAFRGILECFQQPAQWFVGVVVTNGSGSPRDDLYKSFTDEQMQAVRRKEQRKAAHVGEYLAAVLLDYPSSAVKDPANAHIVADLKELLLACRPRIVYTHNPADKHDTHVAVTLRTLQAIRELPEAARPKRVLGCEVWRDLDWMVDEDKVAMDVAAHENLAAALLGVYDSQICGGKRYDLATVGRRRAHATYHASHGTDDTTQLIFAMDLTPLANDPALNVTDYVMSYIDRFAAEVKGRMAKAAGQ